MNNNNVENTPINNPINNANNNQSLGNIINNNQNSQGGNISDFYNRSFFNNNSQPQQPINQEGKKTLGMALMEETYNLPKKANPTNNGLNINQMIDQIRKTIQMLERNGAKIDTDEIDFENQYQIVIRIDKNN